MSDKEIISPYDVFQTSKELECGKGVEIEYPFGVFIIHRAGGSNKAFARVFAEKLKPYRKKFEQGLLDDETKERITIETYAETVIIGWRDVYGKDGKKIPYSVENCIKLFTDLPDLFLDIQEQANNYATFKQEQEEIEEKN